MAASEDVTKYTVGQIPCQESVTPYGGRVYNVPIMIAPLAKSAPEISLQYNSQSGNGLAGYGWNVGGLSAITISNSTIYYNGKTAAADINDPNAVYTLDGIPLVRNDDASLAAEYPLETAKGNVIVKKHLSGNVVSHFTALFPDGSKATFGMTSNTEAKAVYPITSWEDRLGNKTTFHYSKSNSDYRINYIIFKHNNNDVETGRLSFSYSSRADYHMRYRAGQVTYQSDILKSITSSSAGGTLCTYRLTHELRDGVNLLTSIGCTNASGEQLRPLSFDYGDTDGYGYSSSNDFAKSDCLFLSSCFSSSSDVKFIYNRGKYLPDSYNDGLMILPQFKNYAAVLIKKNWLGKPIAYKFGSLYDENQSVLVAPRLNHISDVDNGITAGSGFQCINAADIDGDGVDEIVKVNFNGTSKSASTTTLRITVYGCSASGATYQKKYFDVTVNGIVKSGDYVSPMWRCYQFGDFRGDGKTQLLTISYNKDPLDNSKTSYASLIDLDAGREVSENALLSLGIKDELFCIDMDGDGRTELCHATKSGLNLYNLDGTAFSLTKTLGEVTSTTLSRDYYFLDINGDGYVDIAGKPIGTSLYWYVYRYTGDKFSIDMIDLQGTTDKDDYMFFDVNKDGLSDLVRRNGTTATIYLNENGTFTYGHRITSGLSFAENTKFVPCNLAGYNTMSDFITVEDCYVNLYKFSQDLSSSRLLTKSTNSLGATTVNNYANMAFSNYVYSVDASRKYSSESGYAKCRFPLQLLYNTQTYLTPSMVYTEKISDLWYTYFDACVHTKGLGFCGFGKVRTTDFMSITNKELVTIETKNPENMGVTTRLVHGHRMTQDNPYDITDYTYDAHTTSYGKLNPRLKKVVHADTLSSLKSATSYVYDSYDYPTSIEVQRTVGDSGMLIESQTVGYMHKSSPENYCLGNILSDTRTKTIPAKIIARPPVHFEDLGNRTGQDVLNAKSIDRINPIDTLRNDPIFPFVPKDTSSIFDPVDTASKVGPIIKPGTKIPPSYWIEKQVYTYNDKLQPLTRIDSVGTSAATMKQKLQIRWTYDSYGNILNESSAQYDAKVFIGKTYTYDSNGIKLSTATDELGRTTVFESYDKFGNVLSQIDKKGRKTTYTYDQWGQFVSEAAPDGTLSKNEAFWGGIGKYRVIKSVSGKPTECVHYDALGRDVRSETLRFNMKWICTEKVYGKNGKVQKLSLPFKDDGEATLWNTYEYDEYLRPVSYTQASGHVTTWEYDGTTTRETKNGVWSAKTINSNGQVVKVQDAGGTIGYSLRADGQPSKISVTGGLSTTFEYDAYGRRTKIVDPSAGTQTDSLAFNIDGSSVAVHTNPNGRIITYTDKYGRKTKVERPGEYTTDYVYNSDGLLISEVSSNGTSMAYTYDGFDRLLTVKETVPDGKWLKKSYTYTAGSNVKQVAYESQNGAIATENYDYSKGNTVRIGVQTTHVRLINGENEFGQPTSVSTGDITRTYSYNAYGLPTGRTMGEVMDYSYTFDPLTGNLLNRTDNLRNLTECFGYDELNRLTAIGDRTISYAANGNITSMDSVGEMTYGSSSKPYQLTSLTLEEDVVPSRVQNISYTCYSRPSIMTEGGRSAAFTYNGDGERVKMNVSDGAASVLSRYYIGNQYELDVTPNGVVERLYLGGDTYSAPAVYVKEGSGPWTFYNIGRDYLGNITHIATKDGTLVEENSYDPWGRLRNPETLEIYAPGTEPELMLGRGYTGHEHLIWFGLINMNARLYDPVLGRFLSPDPYVQMPDFTQNFNRYAYGLNNPLVYVDENGEFLITALIIGVSVGAALGIIGGCIEGYQIAERKGLTGSDRVKTIILGGVIGGVAGGIAGLVGGAVEFGVTAAGIGGFIGGAIVGGTSGAIGGFLNGFGMGYLETGSASYGLEQGVDRMLSGAISGALVCGLIQGTISACKGKSFFDGSTPSVMKRNDFLNGNGIHDKIPQYDFDPDPLGDNKTLYRGITGNEGDPGSLFMTDNYDYAKLYGNGKVAEVKLPKITLDKMQFNGDLHILNGIHTSSQNIMANEYQFLPRVKSEIIIRFKF